MISQHPSDLKVQRVFGPLILRQLPLTEMSKKISISQFCALLWLRYLRYGWKSPERCMGKLGCMHFPGLSPQHVT